MAQAAATEKKRGWFSWGSKPAHESIAAIAGDLNITVEVTNEGNPRLAFNTDSATLGKLIKALKSADIEIPDGHMRTSVIFNDPEAIKKVTAVLDKVKKSAKNISFPKLNEMGPTGDINDKLEAREMYVLRQQQQPSIEYVGTIIDLAVREKQFKLNPPKKKKEEEIDLADPQYNVEAAAPAKKKRRAPVEETDFDVEGELKIKNRNGPQGSLVLQVPAAESDEKWMEGAKELRKALGDSGVGTVQLYRSSQNAENRGYIIAGIPVESLAIDNEKSIDAEALKTRIETYVAWDRQQLTDLFPEPEKKAVFELPETLPADRKQAYVDDLRKAFGKDGDKYVVPVISDQTQEMTGVKILGVTKNELRDESRTDGKAGSNAIKTMLAQKADAVREEYKLGERPDLSKSVTFKIDDPKVTPERRAAYIQELQGLYAEHGDKLVTAARSRNVLDKENIRIVGVSSKDLLGDEKKIGNKMLVERLKGIVQRSNAQVVNPETEQAATLVTTETGAAAAVGEATEVSGPTPVDVVKAFMQETKVEWRKFDEERRRLNDTMETGAEEAVKALERGRKLKLDFPKNSNMLIIKNVDRELPQLQELQGAFMQAGYPKTGIVGNDIYIDLTPGEAIGESRLVADGQEGKKPEQALRDLLTLAYNSNFADQLVRAYQQRNSSAERTIG